MKAIKILISLSLTQAYYSLLLCIYIFIDKSKCERIMPIEFHGSGFKFNKTLWDSQKGKNEGCF